MAVEVDNAKEVLDRVQFLRYEHQQSLSDRWRFKSIVNGGREGIEALLGSEFARSGSINQTPIPNLMVSGLDRLAQKIGREPNVKIDIFNQTIFFRKRLATATRRGAGSRQAGRQRG